MTALPVYFGEAARRLCGTWHRAPQPVAGAAAGALIVPPLLQEGVTTYRALMSLAEKLAVARGPVLRFDWFGSGNSAGRSEQMSLPTLRRDLQAALAEIRARGEGVEPRQLALRSGCLPVLAAAEEGAPLHVVLWDPQLRGEAVVSGWRRQHVQQLSAMGRYPEPIPVSDADEIIGFKVAPELLSELSRLDVTERPLPPGSSVLIAAWSVEADVDRFAAVQAAAGVAVETLLLKAADRPAWDDPLEFENQALPRRSVVQLAGHLAEAGL